MPTPPWPSSTRPWRADTGGPPMWSVAGIAMTARLIHGWKSSVSPETSTWRVSPRTRGRTSIAPLNQQGSPILRLFIVRSTGDQTVNARYAESRRPMSRSRTCRSSRRRRWTTISTQQLADSARRRRASWPDSASLRSFLRRWGCMRSSRSRWRSGPGKSESAWRLVRADRTSSG